MEEQLKYGLNLRTHDVPEMVFKARVASALQEGKNRYPIHRRVRFGARVELEALTDALALDPSWRAERIHASYIVMDGEGCSRPGEAARPTTARAPSTSTLATSPRPRPRATASI